MIWIMPFLYALADRFAGGGAPKLDAKLPGRAAFWGALVCAVAGYLLAGVYGALLALAWLIWRTPAWKVVPWASATPNGVKQTAATFVRHALVIPFVGLAAYWSGRDLSSALPFLGFAAAATVLAVWYRREVAKAGEANRPIGNQNTYVELLRGAAFGIAVAVAA